MVAVTVRVGLFMLLLVLGGYAGSRWAPLRALLGTATTTATAAIIIVLVLSPSWTSFTTRLAALFRLSVTPTVPAGVVCLVVVRIVVRAPSSCGCDGDRAAHFDRVRSTRVVV
jgi:hypothetical protein